MIANSQSTPQSTAFREAMMRKLKERRKEERLYCGWPIWFAGGFGKRLFCGEMQAISSTAVSFAARIDRDCPQDGQQVIIHFRIPRFGVDDSDDVVLLSRHGCIQRIDKPGGDLCRIVVQFDRQLPFKPAKLAAVSQALSI